LLDTSRKKKINISFCRGEKGKEGRYAKKKKEESKQKTREKRERGKRLRSGLQFQSKGGNFRYMGERGAVGRKGSSISSAFKKNLSRLGKYGSTQHRHVEGKALPHLLKGGRATAPGGRKATSWELYKGGPENADKRAHNEARAKLEKEGGKAPSLCVPTGKKIETIVGKKGSTHCLQKKKSFGERIKRRLVLPSGK